MAETESCPVNGLLSNKVCNLLHQHSVDKHIYRTMMFSLYHNFESFYSSFHSICYETHGTHTFHL